MKRSFSFLAAAFISVLYLLICLSCKHDGSINYSLNKVFLSTPVGGLYPSEDRYGKGLLAREWMDTKSGWNGFTTSFNTEECDSLKRYFEKGVPIHDGEWDNSEYSFNQYSAIKDLEYLFADTTLAKNGPMGDKERIALWRLDMFYHIPNNKGLAPDQPRVTPCDYNYEGLRILRCQIDSLLNDNESEYYVDQDKLKLEINLNRLFVNVLYDRLLSFSRGEMEVESAAAKHYKAFNRYKEASFSTALAVLFPDSERQEYYMNTVELENLKLQALSILYSAMNNNSTEFRTSMPDMYSLVYSPKVSGNDLLKEYKRLEDYVVEYYKVDEDGGNRAKAAVDVIEEEKAAWINVLKCQKLLSYFFGDEFEAATNLLLKHKWRMLNNQYQDFAFNEDEIKRCLLGEDCTIAELKESTFSDRFASLVNE